MTTVQPGDVLLTRSGGRAGFLIRLGAALRDTPNLQNHVAVVHHRDAKGTLWSIEGRPGGAGWRDTKDYLADKHTMTNAEQPKTGPQRAAVCKTMEAMIAAEYDWAAIVADTGHAFGLDTAWLPDFKTGEVPAAVVCSSLAAYAYDRNGLKHPPGPDRQVTPGMWTEFVLTQAWERK